MAQNSPDTTFVKTSHQFQMEIDGQVAFIDFRETPEGFVLLHTEVPQELQGNGVASRLVEHALEYAEQHGRQIIPKCTYVLAFLKRHPEWERLVHGEK